MTLTARTLAMPNVIRGRSAAGRLGAALTFVCLSAACTDMATMPHGSAPGGVLGIKPELAMVVLHRTTEMDDETGGPRIVRRQTVQQQLRALPHDVAARAGANIVPVGDGRVIDPDKLPTPVLSAPARRQSSACVNALRWTRTVAIPTMPGTVAIASGEGDAPATSIQLVQNGQLIAEMTRSWVRMSRTWELRRQELRVEARHYRDVVDVERRSGTAESLETPVPLFACVAQDSAAAARADAELQPFGGYRTTNIPSALEAPGAPRQIDDCVADGYDNCQDKRDIKFMADVAYVGASALVAITCPTLALVKTDTCIKAISTLGTAIAAELAANHALERCLLDQEARKKACECAGGVAMENRASDGGMTPLAHAWLAPSTSRPFLSCDDVGSSGAEQPTSYQDYFDTSTPPDPGSGGVYLCVYEVDYDLETNTIEVYKLYCYVQWMD
jgi:hypothetical protein